MRLTIAQYGASAAHPEASRDLAVEAAAAAVRNGADVVVLPELCMPGYTTRGEWIEAAAEPIDGPTVSAWLAIARRTGAVIVGGIAERADGGLYNSAVTVAPTGVLGLYRKLHLFGAEKDVFRPGDQGLPVVDTPHGRIGTCVCYDLRFPEVVRILALRDAEIVAVPTAWVAGFDERRWDDEGMCPQAHGAVLQANLNQVFIACASASGTWDGVQFLGSSILVDPTGRRLVGPLPGDGAVTDSADVDLGAVAAARHRGPGIDPRDDRRTDVYSVTYRGVSL